MARMSARPSQSFLFLIPKLLLCPCFHFFNCFSTPPCHVSRALCGHHSKASSPLVGVKFVNQQSLHQTKLTINLWPKELWYLASVHFLSLFLTIMPEFSELLFGTYLQTTVRVSQCSFLHPCEKMKHQKIQKFATRASVVC